MLLHIALHEPRMLLSIAQQTPFWVWLLLLVLSFLGSRQLVGHTVSQSRAFAVPVGMAAFSLYGLATALAGQRDARVLAAGSATWLASAALTASFALWRQPQPPAGSRYDPVSARFYRPGSAAPLLLILGIFLTKYLVGVEMALTPDLLKAPVPALQLSALYGVFNGLFTARTLRLWRLARGTQRSLRGAAFS